MYDNNDIFEKSWIKLFNRRTNSSSMGRIYREELEGNNRIIKIKTPLISLISELECKNSIHLSGIPEMWIW
jgi:hypothetical protein